MFICLNMRKIQKMKISTTTFSLIFFFLAYQAVNAHNRNIAKEASITASSILNTERSAEKVADGIKAVEGLGEWACEGFLTSWGYIELPWIQLDWDQSQKVNRIILYDRATEKEHAASVKLTFSD